MFVYLLEGDGYFKIGVADDVHARVKQLQTGNPHQIRVRKFFNVGDRVAALKVERKFHAALRKIRRSGEWFQIDPEDVFLMDETFSAIAKGDISRLHSLTESWKSMLARIGSRE